jgi:tetratricopeptide (TPR) repeat protein
MRGTIGAFNLAWLLCVLVWCNASHAQSSEAALEEGLKLLAQGKFSTALNHFQQYKQTHPQDARPYFYAGLALTEAGQFSAAALEVDEAVRLDPQRLEALILQANLFARLKQKAAAEEALARLPKPGIERLEASWLWMLSDVYYRLERFPDVLGWLERLAKRNPNDPRLDLNRGQVFVIQSQFEQAQTAFQTSIAKHPTNALAHFELGKLLHLRNDLPAAKTALQAAVRLEQNNPQYLQKLGAICLALKDIDEAIAHLERAAKFDPHSSQAFYSLSQAYQRKGEREKAAGLRQQFQALKQREEAREEVERLLARGERLLDEGNDTEARTTFEQIVAADAQNWTAHGYLAELWLAAGNNEKAWPHLAKMEELDAESVVGNYLLARYWAGRKEFAKARGYAEKVKLARPAHAALRALLGQIYFGLGQRETALTEWEEAVRLAPERADFRAQLEQLKKP